MRRTIMLATLLCCAISPTAHAQIKTLEIYVGTSVGAGYDTYARLLSRSIGQHRPGSPAVVVKNMAGAGGMTLATWLDRVAAKDGSVIGTFGRGIAFERLLNPAKTFPDGRSFNWIGSMNDEVSVCVAMSSSNIKTFEDLQRQPLTVGASGAGGDTFIFPTVLNGVLGTQLKIINGYPGGNEISLAMERGEVAGRCGWSWSSLQALHGDLVSNGKMRVLVQLGLTKHPDLPNVPLAQDFAKTEDQRSALELIFARQAMAWPYAAPPGTPKARVDELRKAFASATADPELLAAAQKSGLEVRPVSGANVEKIVDKAYRTPAPLVKLASELLQ
ncbi:tripartite tricarboxylate transporter substrate-binding protein [Roseiarcaceae bacterium H3SJ34-1]|uniref:Bug family tripartite tricarboxylate transporter substrate binding protein n=1 Tax=Terripilifer ovatus TaxID=3032367 RepID=UPI003AB9861C|nr:tripartite tricarboxylate transporter substrate-binding protein [Roseiarcaceae bacterium H3SJ34-1]